MDTRQHPQSLEAERALLGGLLLDHGQVAAISEVLAPMDFHSAAHRKIFELMLSRYAQSEALDVLGLTDHILSTGQAEEFGGLSYATSLPELVPSTENLEYYARIIKDKAVRRRLMEVTADINARVLAGADELPELLDHAESSVFQVAQQRAKKDWQVLGQVIDVEWQKLETRTENRGAVTGVRTGFLELDEKLAGLQPSDLIVLAARPAMGKTALALNIAQRAAVDAGVAVGIFSLEMAAGQLALRILSSEARVDAGKIRTGMLSRNDDWVRLEDAHEVLYQQPVWIDDTAGLTITQLRSKARRLASMCPTLGLIVIDYLQLMGSGGAGSKNESREQQIGRISRGLKALAKELELPVLALSQLNRGVESRADKRPLISDLRESGAIEQDADVILFIYRDDYYLKEKSTKPGVAEVIIAKQRNGPTGTVDLAFEGRFTRFDNLAPDYASYG
ncbi:MAG TPA: replicative DNA helicase [Myxococcota bacterium]|nr:replicative DNA helicase [Myxococcota bacterium]